jgi:hypothetical protein
MTLQPHSLEPATGDTQGFFARHSAKYQADRNVLFGRLPRHERIHLKQVGGLCIETLGQLLAEHAQAARRRPGEPGRHVQQCRLAATRGADNRDELSVPYRQTAARNCGVGLGMLAIAGKGAGHVVEA